MSKHVRTTDVGRRDALIGAGAAVAAGAAAMLAGKAKAAQMAPPREAPRWAMVFDLRKCIGCRGCTVACKAEFEVPLNQWRAVVQAKEIGEFPKTKKIFVPLMCNHCEGDAVDEVPPCVKACPQYPGERAEYTAPDGKKIRYRTGATYKRPDGMILIDNSQCIGCGRCIEACPYGVRSFNPLIKAGKAPDKNGIEKCSMCQHRVDQGVEPACVQTCTGTARIFGDLKDPESQVAKLIAEWKLADNRDKTTLLPEAGTFPHVFYIDPDGVLKAAYQPREPGKLDHYRDQFV